MGASDGSVMDNTLASYAVKLNLRDEIKNNSNAHSISAVGGVDGAPGHISSLRAESRGAIAILLLIHIVCKKWVAPLEKVRDLTLLFDSDTVVTRSEADPSHRNDFLSMDFDLWVEMKEILQQIPFKIKFQWIASHQDNNNSNTPLSNGATLNIQVDHMAGEYRRTMTTHIPTLAIPSGKIAIGIRGVRYHHFPAATIRKVVHEQTLRNYIMKKTGWHENQISSIEWESYERALKVLSPSMQVNWIKLAHNWQHTNHQRNHLNGFALGAHKTFLQVCSILKTVVY